jgi:hypothetical protein
MATFFNLARLEIESKKDSKRLVETLRLHFINKTKPKNARQEIKPLSNLKGNSFLLNPEPLFNDKSTDVIYKAQYIKLAGRRDYLLYQLYGHRHLDLSYFLDIDINLIRHNPLLTIKDNKIYFKYEELT